MQSRLEDGEFSSREWRIRDRFASILPQGVAAVISYCRLRPWQAYDSPVAPSPTPILPFLAKTARCLLRAISARLEQRTPLKVRVDLAGLDVRLPEPDSLTQTV